MLKHKTGICIDCPPDDNIKVCIAGRCVNYHYLKYRRTQWKQKEPKPRKPITKQSDKQKKISRAYTILRQKFLSDYPMCQCRKPGCTNTATQVHHMAGRGMLMLDTTKWLAICHNCHEWATINSQQAIKEGYSLSRIKINQ